MEVKSQSKSLTLKSVDGTKLQRKLEAEPEDRRFTPSTHARQWRDRTRCSWIRQRLPPSLFQAISSLHPQARWVPLRSAGRNQPPLSRLLFLKLPLLNNTDTLLWSRHPFLNEAQAPPRKGKHRSLARSLSSFCSNTIMHIVCTAPPTHTLPHTPPASNPPFHVDFLSLALSPSLWHACLVCFPSLCNCNVNRSDSGRRACECPVA